MQNLSKMVKIIIANNKQKCYNLKDENMKKLAIFFLILVIIVVGISYMYLNYKATYNQAKRDNMQFESYYNQEIYGTDLATIINKAVDSNKNNEIQKDNKGKYINNDKDSINIDIKMLDDNGTIYSMEKIFNGGTSTFVQYYSQIKFKCTKLQYHQKTNKVKYLLFEQITE